MNWTRSVVLGFAVWITGCSGDWSADERAQFMGECRKSKIADERLREVICDCSRERAEEEHSFAAIMGQDPAVRVKLSIIIQTCAQEHGLRTRPRGEG